MHRRRGRRHFRPGPQNRTSWSGEFNKHLTNWISLPPLCLSVTVTEYNPVEAQINPTLGNRAAQTNGQPCAEKSGTQTEAPAFSHPTRWRLLTDLFLALTDWILRFCKSDVISTFCFSHQSPKKVGDDIAKATGDWKGLRITVKLTIQNRQAAVRIMTKLTGWSAIWTNGVDLKDHVTRTWKFIFGWTVPLVPASCDCKHSAWWTQDDNLCVFLDRGRSLCVCSDHQGSEGASSWQEEGQEQ